jgi:ferrous iron transport protein A
MTLDALPIGQRARVTAVDWAMLAPDEAQRLQALGVDVGARVAVAHRGVFGGADPIAVSVGRMTVALRRSHARVMAVELLAGTDG